MNRICLLAIIASLCIAGCKKEPSSFTVAKRDVEGYLVLKGELITPPTAYAEVLTPYKAPVEKVMVTEGAQVREGEVLMQLSFPNAQAAVEQAKASVQSAQTALANSTSSYKQIVDSLNAQMRDLKTRQSNGEEVSNEISIVQDQLNDAIADREAQSMPNKQSLASAQQNLKDAQTGTKMASIRSPISGTVLSVNAQAGQTVGEDASKPVATVCNLGALQVQCALEPQQTTDAKRRTPVKLTFDGMAEEFEGRVSKILTRTNGSTVQYIAVIEFDNKQGLVKPGAKLAGAAIKTGDVKNVLAVPTEAVDKDSTGKAIVNVLNGEKWVPTIVEAGLSGAGFTEIKSGLKEGDVVQVTP